MATDKRLCGYTFLSGMILCLPFLVLMRSECLAESKSKKRAAETRIPATVKQVVDGDTIDVVTGAGKKRRVNMLYVKTEESAASDNKQNTEFGKKTAKWVKDTIKSETQVRLESEEDQKEQEDGEKKAYIFVWIPKLHGKILTNLVHDGDYAKKSPGEMLSRHKQDTGKDNEKYWANLNVILVRHGLSPYFIGEGRSGAYNEQFDQAEKYARKHKLGIWESDENSRKYVLMKEEWNKGAAEEEAEDQQEFEVRVDDEGGTRVPIAAGRLLFMQKEAADFTYASSTKSDEFHKLDCKHVKNIKPRDLVKYVNRDQAKADEKKPCEDCKP